MPPSRLLLLGILLLAAALPNAQAQTCEGFVLPPSLPLTSYDGTYRYDDAGFMLGGVTDTFGCVIAATQANLAYPLDSFVSTAIPVAVERFVYDNGGLLPFLPFFSGGNITWFTLRLSDGTVGTIIGSVTLVVIPT